MGCEQLRPVVREWEDDDAIEIDVLEAHRRDVPQEFRVDFSPRLPLPKVEGALQMASIVGHDEIRAEREAVRLGAELLLTLPTCGSGARAADLSLQLMGSLIVVEVPEFFAPIVGVRV